MITTMQMHLMLDVMKPGEVRLTASVTCRSRVGNFYVNAPSTARNQRHDREAGQK